MPRLTRRRAILFLLTVGVGFLLLYDRATTLLGSGGVNLPIRIQSALPFREASTEVFWRREPVGSSVHCDPPLILRLKEPVPASGLHGEPFEVWVPIESRISGLGLTTVRTQAKYLAVVAVLADGRRVGKVVELPDARESREVTVRLD